jgi:hypothetical protein
MESKQSQVARILNSTSNAFFNGLDKERFGAVEPPRTHWKKLYTPCYLWEDQSSLCGVLEEYFYENDAE